MLAQIFLILLGCIVFSLGICLIAMSLIYTVNHETFYALASIISGFGGLVWGIWICEDASHG